MHKGVGIGIELLIQFSPRPTPSAIGKMMPPVWVWGFLRTTLYPIACDWLLVRLQSKASANETSGLSTDLNLSPFKYFRSASPALSLSSSASKQAFPLGSSPASFGRVELPRDQVKMAIPSSGRMLPTRD